MTDEMISKLAGYIAGEMLKQPGRAIAPGEALISSGLVDSFSPVDLALFVEDNYGVVIADTELNASVFDTLDQLAAFIRSRM
jgi:acyl carrier protein